MPSQFNFKSDKLQMNFYSLTDAEKIDPKNNMALVSILDPDIKSKINYDSWRYYITLRFDDTTNPDDGEVAFNRAMANKIIDFALELPDATEYIIVHCLAGVSRSGAVIKFLSKYIFPECFNEQFDKDYIFYNKMVYKFLCSEWKARTKNAPISLNKQI